MLNNNRFKSGIALCVLTYTSFSNASDSDSLEQLKATQNHLVSLSLKELIDVEITSVSKKPQKLSSAAAAIHVITQEDISRSGVTSIPEALRLAPGITVARQSSDIWAISSRGLDGRYSTTLLVVIDGREVYNPVSNGVLWDTVDLMLEDIERIEVIRGPGSTLWGMNAVNGVINIITKSASDTVGGKLAAYGGNIEASGALRYGVEVDDHSEFRVYAKYLNRAANVNPSGISTHDDQDIISGGFRAELQLTPNDQLMFDGRYYESQSGVSIASPTLTPPYSEPLIGNENEVGGHFLSKWSHRYSDTSSHFLKIYYNLQDRVFPFMDARVDTVDIDFQHQFSFWDRHSVIWGLGYRYQYFQSKPGSLVNFIPEKQNLNTYNFFIHDDISLIQDELRLIIGTKVEKAFFTDVQLLPSIRMAWTPTSNQTLWGAISRAVRNPSVINRSIQSVLSTIPPGPASMSPIPISPALSGNPDIKPEELIAYELGYRIFLWDQVSLDISGFYNDYDNLTTAQVNGPPQFMVPPPHLELPLQITNGLKGETYGVEIDAAWQVLENWRLTGYYSFIQMHLDISPYPGDPMMQSSSDDVSRQQFSIRSSFDFLSEFHWDLWLRYVDQLPSRLVGDYTTLDTRLAWRPVKDLEFSIVGQNLIDSGHIEFTSEFVQVDHSTIERSFYFKVDWDF